MLVENKIAECVMVICKDTNGSRFQSHRPNTHAASHSLPWLLGRVPNGYWAHRENRRGYMTWLAERCAIFSPSDWYRIRKKDFLENHGSGLLRNHYGCSVQSAVAEFLPHVDWKAWLFGATPKGFWQTRQNRVDYMTWLGQQLNYKTTDDWYNVIAAHFHKYHGGGLLNNEFRGCVQAVVRDFIPDFDWHEWLFRSVPQKFWQQATNRCRYLCWLGTQIGIQRPVEWEKLTQNDFCRHNGAALLTGVYRGSVRRAAKEARRLRALELLTEST